MVQVGDRIKIIYMKDEPLFDGREGTVEFIDDAGQIHGTWGCLAIIPATDVFKIIERSNSETLA